MGGGRHEGLPIVRTPALLQANGLSLFTVHCRLMASLGQKARAINDRMFEIYDLKRDKKMTFEVCLFTHALTLTSFSTVTCLPVPFLGVLCGGINI